MIARRLSPSSPSSIPSSNSSRSFSRSERVRSSSWSLSSFFSSRSACSTSCSRNFSNSSSLIDLSSRCRSSAVGERSILVADRFVFLLADRLARLQRPLDAGQALEFDVVALRQLDEPVDGRHPGIRVLVQLLDDLGRIEDPHLVGRDHLTDVLVGIRGQPSDRPVVGRRIAQKRLDDRLRVAPMVGDPVEHPRVIEVVEHADEDVLRHLADRRLDLGGDIVGVVEVELVQKRHRLRRRRRHHPLGGHHLHLRRRIRIDVLLEFPRELRHLERVAFELVWHGGSSGY